MPETHKLIDIHCHIIPDIDDGARDWNESLAMARLAVEDGIGTIIATPHQLGAHSKNTSKMIRTRVDQARQIFSQQHLPLEILPGGDIRIEPDLVGKICNGEALPLTGESRYVLLELPHEIFLPIDQILMSLKRLGLTGILSHPERNQGILGNPDIVDQLVSSGCLMQLTAGSLLGRFGQAVQGLSENLITEGLVHFLATDSHGSKSRRPLLRRAFDRVTELTSIEIATTLCRSNPAAIVADKLVQPGRLAYKRSIFNNLFKRKKVS